MYKQTCLKLCLGMAFLTQVRLFNLKFTNQHLIKSGSLISEGRNDTAVTLTLDDVFQQTHQLNLFSGVDLLTEKRRLRRNVESSESSESTEEPLKEKEENNCTILPQKSSKSSNNETLNINVIDILNSGLKYLELDQDVKEVILVMGNTGSGKSTYVQILAGDLSKLNAVLTQKRTLVIIDDANRIGDPSTMSKTLFPEVILLKQGNKTTALLDCPGFNDNRGPDQDIAANFFINQIIKRVSKVKIIFLVNHSSVKIGNDRSDFGLLVTYSTSFLKNINKYIDSIGLVVTKVASKDNLGQYMDDKLIIEQTVEYLEEYKATQAQILKSKNGTDVDVIKEKLKFVSALLAKNKKRKYGNLSFSRDPTYCGPLNDSHVVLETKTRGLKFLDKLQYSLVDEKDFGYSLKDSTLLQMKSDLETSNNAFAESVSKLIINFQNWYLKDHFLDVEINSSSLVLNVQQTLDRLDNLNNTLQSYFASSGKMIDMNKVIFLLTTTFDETGFHVPNKIKSIVETRQRYFHFYYLMSNNAQVNIDNENWLRSLKDLKQTLNDTKNWYKFCEETEKTSQSYAWQQQKPTVPPGTFSLVDYMKSIWGFDVELFYPNLGAKQKNVLESILKFALQPAIVMCSETEAKVVGNYIRLSELFDPNGHRKGCLANARINRIEIYSTRVLYIDTDIQAVGEELNLVMMSVKWEVVGWNRVINLRGNHGSPPVPRTAKHGYHRGPQKGEDGKAGEPGVPGGSFFGICSYGVNLNNLIISTSGGDGSDGQNGGNSEQIKYPGPGWVQREITERYPLYPIDGGDGGRRGDGASPGLNQMHFLVRQTQMPRLVSEKGKNGEHGKAGRGVQGRNITRNSDIVSYPCINSCRDGGSYINHKNPSRPKYSIVEWDSVVNFKIMLYAANKADTVSQSMITSLENDTSLRKYQSIKAYAKELIEILKKTKSLAPATVANILKDYISFLKKFTKSKLGALSNEEQKVSVYLLSLAYSSIAEIDESKSTDVVVDIVGYFEIVKQRMTHFKESQALISITEAQATFTENLQKKIDVTKQIQIVEIEPALKKAEQELDDQLELMGQQFVKIIEDVEANAEKAKDAVKKAEIVLGSRIAFKIFVAFAYFGGLILSGGSAYGLGISGAVAAEDVFHQVASSNSAGQFKTPDISYDELSELVNRTKNFADKIKNGTEGFGLGLDKDASSAIKMNYYFGEKITGSISSAAQSKDEVGKAKAILQQTEFVLKDVQNRNELLHNVFIPAVQGALSNFQNVLQAMKNDSDSGSLHPSKLKIGQLKFSRALKEIKENFILIGRGLQTKDFESVLEKTKDYLEMMISLFQDIERFEDTQNLGYYLEVLNSAQLRNIQVRNRNLASALASLQEFNTKNLFAIEYKRALQALRQWVFPFGKLYLTKDLQYFEQDESGILTEIYAEQTKKIQLELQKFKSTVQNSHDANLIFSNFSSGYISSQPFHIWNNKKHFKSISDLLSGKPANFYSDVRSSPNGKDAIKFKVIEIKVNIPKTKETEMETQEKLDEEMKNFAVLLTHSGVSHYRFKDNFYSMYGKNVTIRYAFEVDEVNGERQGRNGVYGKFKNGDYLLSPYTFWTVQLIRLSEIQNTGSRNGVRLSSTGFENLQRFIPYVDLELQGRAVYVDSKRLTSELEVDSFYERNKSIRIEED